MTPSGIEELTSMVSRHGDLAHVALALWAFSASSLVILMLRLVRDANARYSTFIAELSRLTAILNRNHPPM